jgi:hypothetical protein
MKKLSKIMLTVPIVVGCLFAATAAMAANKKPNILVMWGDDIGVWTTSAYNRGVWVIKHPILTQ